MKFYRMAIKLRLCICFLFLIAIIVSCRKNYMPPAISAPNSYLVVEGVINNGADSTIIKLSKTVNLAAKVISNPQKGAAVSIESSLGQTFSLSEVAAGKYGTGGLQLDNSQKYRLRIKLADNRSYLSDFVPVVNAPPIDSIGAPLQSNGIQINLSSHDPANNTHYYRWDYQETWVVHSHFYSFYKSNGDTVLDRNLPSDQIYECWQSDTSGTIVLGSSANLSKDVISNIPVTFIPSNSVKLDGSQSIIVNQYAPSANAYSILVRQFALTADAFRFWENLKKNTEQLGGVFDAQPSQISGNIHSLSDPNEPVIGYVSAGSITSKRIFIANEKIPFAWLPDYTQSGCTLDTLLFAVKPKGSAVVINEENEYFNYNKDARLNTLQIPIAAIYNVLNGKLIGHSGAIRPCADCTLRGTNHEPLFWK